MPSHRIASALLTLLLLPASAGAQLNLGTIGDSMTDEYLPADPGNQFHTDVAAHSWLEILAIKRPADFNLGTYKAPPDLWDNNVNVDGTLRDDPRDHGHERNWAKVGGAASRNSLIRVDLGSTVYNLPIHANLFGMRSAYGETMAAGLATQITAGDIDTVFIGLGSNDFFYQTRQFDAQRNDFPRTDVDTSDPAWQDSAAADISAAILAALDTVLSAGTPNVIIAQIPEGTASSSAQQDAGTIAAIGKANALLTAGAMQRGVPAAAIVDLFGFETAPNGDVTVGSTVIPAGSAAGPEDLSESANGPCNSAGLCAKGTHAQKYSAEDGLHPNTLIQGLMANQIIAALNSAYSAGITPLTDAEIKSAAGIPPGC